MHRVKVNGYNWKADGVTVICVGRQGTFDGLGQGCPTYETSWVTWKHDSKFRDHT